MRTGVFYRSEDLNTLSDADSATIFSSLSVYKDIDLRTPSEYQAKPDQNVPASVLPVIHVNIFGTDSPHRLLLRRRFCTVDLSPIRCSERRFAR